MMDGGSDTTPAPSPIDAFLATTPEDKRGPLEALRRVIRAVVPEADEAIQYRVPTFKYRGKALVGFGYATHHCSFFVMSSTVMRPFAEELAGYDTSTGTIRFKPGSPLPDALVTKLVRARMAEVDAAASERR